MSEINVYLWDQTSGAFQKWSIHTQVEGAGSSFNSGMLNTHPPGRLEY